jgi:AbrB family looped-hinge helix DNA binding protein
LSELILFWNIRKAYILKDNIRKESILGDVGLSKKEKEISFTIYVRKEGRITIPKEVRDALGVGEGALIECKVKKVKRER